MTCGYVKNSKIAKINVKKPILLYIYVRIKTTVIRKGLIKMTENYERETIVLIENELNNNDNVFILSSKEFGKWEMARVIYNATTLADLISVVKEYSITMITIYNADASYVTECGHTVTGAFTTDICIKHDTDLTQEVEAIRRQCSIDINKIRRFETMLDKQTIMDVNKNTTEETITEEEFYSLKDSEKMFYKKTEEGYKELSSKKQAGIRKSPAYHKAKGMEYLYECFNFHIALGENTLYYSKKGATTGVVTPVDSGLLAADIENHSLGGYDMTSKRVAQLCVAEQKYIEQALLETRQKSAMRIALRLAVSTQDGCTYYNSADFDPLTGAGIIRINQDGSYDTTVTDIPSDIGFKLTNGMGSVAIDTDAELKDILDFWNHVNVPEKSRIPLLASVVSHMAAPRDTCPILYIVGEAGTGKTTTSSRVKQLFDPSADSADTGDLEPGADLPQDENNFAVICTNQEWVNWENISSIGTTKSDFMARAATGGAFTRRTLHTEFGQSSVRYKVPQTITTIRDLTLEEDLRTRTIPVYPEVLNSRIPEQVGYMRWVQAAPKIRGGILLLAAEASKRYKEVVDSGRSSDYGGDQERMSTYFIMLRIVDEILKDHGLLDTSTNSQCDYKELSASLREQSLPDIIEFMIHNEKVTEVSGRPQAILGELLAIAEECNINTRYWPQSGRGMGICIKNNEQVILQYFDKTSVFDSNRKKIDIYTKKNISQEQKDKKIVDSLIIG